MLWFEELSNFLTKMNIFNNTNKELLELHQDFVLITNLPLNEFDCNFEMNLKFFLSHYRTIVQYLIILGIPKGYLSLCCIIFRVRRVIFSYLFQLLWKDLSAFIQQLYKFLCSVSTKLLHFPLIIFHLIYHLPFVSWCFSINLHTYH